jgi:hypothetical protein
MLARFFPVAKQAVPAIGIKKALFTLVGYRIEVDVCASPNRNIADVANSVGLAISLIGVGQLAIIPTVRHAIAIGVSIRNPATTDAGIAFRGIIRASVAHVCDRVAVPVRLTVRPREVVP